jgi:hypothetical protein
VTLPAAPPTFAARLADELSSVPGSVERSHVASLARCAMRMQLQPDVCRAAAETMRLAPGSIEHHLDRLALPDGLPLWIEYPHADRMAAYGQETGLSTAGQDVPERVACLLAADPANPAHIAGFVSWRLGDARIMQSYALLHWDLQRMAQASREASRSGDTGAERRLFALADVVVPPGFLSEMEVLLGSPGPGTRFEHALRRTERDALGEHLFLLSALLLATSSAVTIERETQPAANKTLPTEEADGLGEPVTWMVEMNPDRPAARDWLGRRRSGFRAPRFGGPLSWTQPVDVQDKELPAATDGSPT